MWELFNSVRTGPEHAVSAAAVGPPVGLSRAGKLASWEHVLLKEVLRVTMLALALALLCSSVVFLEQVVSGKLMWLFEVDHYISWKNQQAMERLLVPVGETLFCLREGRFIKPTTQDVQGRNPASLLAGNHAWGTLSPWTPFCQAAQRWGCGTMGILVLPSSSPASDSCLLSPPLLMLPTPFYPH